MKLLVFLSLFAVCVFARKTFHGDQVLRLHPITEGQLNTLQNLEKQYELDFWTPVRGIGIPVDIRVPSGRLASFKAYLSTTGIHYAVFIDDVQNYINAERTEHPTPKALADFNYHVYHHFDEIQQWISDMAAAHPKLLTNSTVGTSYEGLKFSALTVTTKKGNPQFVINCGIHAREWISPATCMFSVKQLVTEYGTDPTITGLLDKVDFVFIPSSNPDGYQYTWSDDRMWRKTRTPSSARCTGVDPNRNWDANFGGPGASDMPCSDTYYGPYAFSEPCTLAQKKFVEGLPNPKMYIDVHSYSQLWMFPYGYKLDRPSNFDTLDKIANDSVAAIKVTHGKTYQSGQISTTIYVASGSTADYFYDNVTPCSFAAELRDEGQYGFLLPESEIQPTAEESLAAFQVMAQAIIDHKCDSY